MKIHIEAEEYELQVRDGKFMLFIKGPYTCDSLAIRPNQYYEFAEQEFRRRLLFCKTNGL